MMRHPLLAILLALVLALGTALSGPARAQGPGRVVELCAGTTTVTVTLYDQGRPVPSHRPCPHCLAAQDPGLPTAPVAPPRPVTATRAAPPATAPAPAPRPVAAPTARAPPRQA